MPSQLSVNDRVLLHLSKFATDTPPEIFPAESTQVGIAEGIGISRTHVPRAVKTLIREGFVEEVRARVADRERKMSVYAVTPEGFRKAESIWDSVRRSEITVVRNGVPTEMSGGSLEELVGRRPAVGLVARMRERTVELSGRGRAPVRLLGGASEREEFSGRAGEMEALNAFLESSARVMIVMGGRGFGTTSLVRESVHIHDSLDVAWFSLQELPESEQLEEAIVSFSNRIDPEATDVDSVLSLPNVLLVFDDYYSVNEGIVELFHRIVASKGPAKIIVVAREDMPAYSWFYQRRHVQSGVVNELRIKGLDEESARKLLGNPDIEPDAFRRVYLMTRGQPLLLGFLRDGNTDDLVKASVFTAEEARYLLFLSRKKA